MGMERKQAILVLILKIIWLSGSSQFSIHTNIINSNANAPYYDLSVNQNVTTTVGQTAFLPCKVENIGDKEVGWIRKKDLHILTAGLLTYTSDQRFQVFRPDKSNTWMLQIKYSQIRDSGIYECQINAEPKISLPFYLNVVVPKAQILGPTDLHVKEGSDIILTCVIDQEPHVLDTIFWLKNGEEIDVVQYKKEFIGKEIIIENHWKGKLASRLRIRNVGVLDSGNYSCVPKIAQSSSVNVHVIMDEWPAAMQDVNLNAAARPPLFVSTVNKIIGFTIFILFEKSDLVTKILM